MNVTKQESNRRYQDKVRNMESRVETRLARHPASFPVYSVPVRDTWKDGAPVAFVLDFYGIGWQLGLIQASGPPDPSIGSAPIVSALRKRGLDPERYQTFMWDLP